MDYYHSKTLVAGYLVQERVFSRYSRGKNAVENAIIKSYLQEVSTRMIQNVLSNLGVEKISASYVSSIVNELDTKVMGFLLRLVEPHLPCLFDDTSYFKIRHRIKYTNKTFLMIASIRNEGIRAILEAGIAACDHELILEDLFSDLKDSGLRRVDLIISDGYKDIRNVAQRSFHG